MAKNSQGPKEFIKVEGGLQVTLMNVLEDLDKGIITITDLTEALQSEANRLDDNISRAIAGEEVRVASTLLTILANEIEKLSKAVKEAAQEFSTAVLAAGYDPRFNDRKPLKLVEWNDLD